MSQVPSGTQYEHWFEKHFIPTGIRFQMCVFSTNIGSLTGPLVKIEYARGLAAGFNLCWKMTQSWLVSTPSKRNTNFFQHARFCVHDKLNRCNLIVEMLNDYGKVY